MTTTPAIGGFTVLVPQLSRYQKTADEINTVCAQQQLPPAFDIKPDSLNHSATRIAANPTFRFEEFGLALGLRPKISFRVHYMPNHKDHIDLGRFLAPLCLSDLVKC